jgi:hypothetical protein
MRKVTLPVLQSIVDDGKTSGRLWYAAAERDILTVCESEPWSQSSVCDCLALFSPRVSVRRSIRLTFRYLYDGSFFPSTFRAVRQSVLHWERTGIIRGKKTSAFSSALAGHQTAVVLDVHMANIFNVPQQKLFRQDVYASILGKLCKLSPRSIFHPNSEPLIPRGPDRHLAESFRIFGQSVDTLRKGRYIGPTLTASGSSGDRKEPSDGTSEKTFPVRP